MAEGSEGLEVLMLPEDAGQRLDQALATRLPELSRVRLQALIREGRLMGEAGPVVEPARRLQGGERFRLTIPPPVAASPLPEAIPLDVLYEDEHLIVLVKPAGLVVHPAPGHGSGTLVNALLAHCGASLSGIGGVSRPGIVHRLDKDVSGVMVAAKHDRAHIGLAGQFSVHSVSRVYEGIVWGVPRDAGGRIDRPLGRHPVDRMRMSVVKRGGKRAVTDWRRLETAGTRAARVELTLQTGRTHQIRVHLASLGHPLVGDAVYGRGRSDPRLGALERVMLHARLLGFSHPVTGERVEFERPPPEEFQHVLEILRS